MDYMRKERIFRFVIDYLVENRGMSTSEASKVWYNSKTKKCIFDIGDSMFDGIAQTRVCSELLMELDGNPYWMCSSFD